jgi:hypothetical protein
MMVYLAGVFLLALGCDRTGSAGRDEKNPDVCKVTGNPLNYLDKEIELKGKIQGFHHLIMYDDKCYGPRSSILVWTSSDIRQIIIEKIENTGGQNLKDGNLNFIAALAGKLERVNHIDPSKSCYAPPDVVSSQIEYCLSVSSVSEIYSFSENK